jgi:hypothetical protein
MLQILEFYTDKENMLLLFLGIVMKINVEPWKSLQCISSDFLHIVMLPRETQYLETKKPNWVGGEGR